MNPELRRNAWLEVSTHRMIAMPVVLGLIFIVVAAIEPEQAQARLAWLGLAGFAVITALWGMRLCASTIFDELAEKTWDWQRLSTLSPWEMTWGKLLGATLYAWYGGLICLVVYLYYAPGGSGIAPFKTAATLILGAVALHAGTLASALLNARRAGGAPQNRRSFGLLILLGWIYGGAFALPRATGGLRTINWYDIQYPVPDFMLVSVAAFAAWALLGASRSMSQSLAVPTAPWAVLGFVAFLTLYSAGFVVGSGPLGNGTLGISTTQVVMVMGLGWSSVLTYLLLFTEPSGPIVIRRVLRKTHLRQWRRAFEEIPCWPLTWLLMALCAVVLALNPLDTVPAFAGNWAFAPLPFALLVARDAAILLFFSAGPQPRRAVGTTLIYIVILDWLAPGLLAVMGLSPIAALVLPVGHVAGGHTLQTLVALLQALAAGTIAYRRIASLK